MKNFTKINMFVLAFGITNIFCFGQQNRSAICRLGEVTNDSLLPYIQSLQVDCNTKDLKTFTKKADQLTALTYIVLQGDAGEKDWTELFQKIKTRSSLKAVVFDKNTFTNLPSGYEGLYTIQSIVFKNNDELDYSSVIDQLAALPNLNDLTLEIVTIFDLPKTLEKLKNITTLSLINTDETISKNDTSLFSVEKDPITFDYYINKGNEKYVSVKYTSMAGEIDSDEYKELSKRFTTTNNFPGTPATYIPKYVNVNPPIKGIDVERTGYVINPEIENIITYPSGTKILIPANSFEDKYGNPVKGSVTLSYREFRDPVDFLVSGIPMKYDTGGVVTNFESAGMFEMTASSKSEPIQLAKDKKIDMNFSSTSKDSTYNFYSFNDSSGNWEYLNKPKTVTNATAIIIKGPTKAYLEYRNLISSSARIYDSTDFSKRFDSNRHLYTDIKLDSGKQWFSYRDQRKDRGKPINSLVRINRVKRTKDGDVLFKVSYLSDAHPEMREFNDVYFALSENISQAEFREKYARRKFYNDIRVYTNGNDVELKLKDNKSIKDISASLVTIDQKGKIQNVKNVSTRMKRYNRRLSAREREFNKKLAKGKLSGNTYTIKDPKELKAYALSKVKKMMNSNESKMTSEEWESYYQQTEKNQVEMQKLAKKDKIASLNASEATISNLTQSLSIDGMGIYNCDQIQRMKNPVEIFASYKTSDNKKLKATSVYVIDKNSNSVFQYDGYRGFSADKIAFSKSPSAQNTLLAIENDGSIAVYRTEEFKKNQFRNKSNFDFTVTKIDSNFNSVADLKTLIGF